MSVKSAGNKNNEQHPENLNSFKTKMREKNRPENKDNQHQFISLINHSDRLRVIKNKIYSGSSPSRLFGPSVGRCDLWPIGFIKMLRVWVRTWRERAWLRWRGRGWRFPAPTETDTDLHLPLWSCWRPSHSSPNPGGGDDCDPTLRDTTYTAC